MLWSQLDNGNGKGQMLGSGQSFGKIVALLHVTVAGKGQARVLSFNTGPTTGLLTRLIEHER